MCIFHCRLRMGVGVHCLTKNHSYGKLVSMSRMINLLHLTASDLSQRSLVSSFVERYFMHSHAHGDGYILET
jgi:hypothetical protein